MKKVITIDGVVCAGKGAVAKGVAAKLGFLHVSSGEIYRAIGYFVNGHIGEDEAVYTEKKMEELVAQLPLEIRVEEGRVRYIVDNEDVTNELVKEVYGRAASRVAVFPIVRQRANSILRRLPETHDVVMDGRDAGTVIFPEADLKVFLTADVEVRAQRRVEQLQEKGLEATLEEVLADLKARDERDMTRAVDPLKKPEGALEIDTTHRTLEDEVEEIVQAIS